MPGRARRSSGGQSTGTGTGRDSGTGTGTGWDSGRDSGTGTGRDNGWGVASSDPADSPADPESVARLICLRLLTAAPRTRAELADALKRRRVPADAAETVLGRFAEVGLIDDAMFATAWVESRHYGRGLGRRALAAELDRRGVAREDIEVAVDHLSAETERATALALVERKIASTAGPPGQARVRKLVGMLARKGYPPGLAYSVVREALDRSGSDSAGLAMDEDAFADDEPVAD